MVRKIVIALLLSSSLFAKVTNIPATKAFVEKTPIKIIDIRTKSEWEEKGVIKKAYLITFFDEHSGYDIDSFLKELNKIVKKDEAFAIISDSGSRSKLVANFLGVKNSYDVVNLTGGMNRLKEEGFNVVHYNENRQKISMILSKFFPNKVEAGRSLDTPTFDSNLSH